MVIRIALLLLLSALVLLGLADLLSLLTLLMLSEFITQLGLALLFCAFAIFLTICVLHIAKHSLQATRHYFSKSERGQRRLLFIQNQQQQLTQLFQNRVLRIHHLHELKRKHLLRRNQQKHLNALAKSINQDINNLKKRQPKAVLKQLQQQNRQYHKQQDSTALLQLQQHIHNDY